MILSCWRGCAGEYRKRLGRLISEAYRTIGNSSSSAKMGLAGGLGDVGRARRDGYDGIASIKLQ
jgi:hypothetical protein